MPYYSNPDSDTLALLRRVVETYHGPLHSHQVQFDVLVAWGNKDDDGEITSPAIRVHGYQAVAAVRVISLRDRAKGMGDAEITIDGDHWDEYSEAERIAILDHELEHLEPVVDDEGRLKRDDLERPRLRLRRHDHHFGWFDCVARRHGRASLEVQQYERFTASPAFQQKWLPGMEVEA